MSISRRGFTFIEACAAMAVLGLAVVLASGIVLRRQAIARQIDERVVALRIASSEIDDILTRGSLVPQARGFTLPETTPLLRNAHGLATIEPFERGSALLKVRVELRWGRGGHVVRETLATATP